MAKLLVCLTVCIVGVAAVDGHMSLKDHVDDDFASTLPTPTESENNLFSNKSTSKVPNTSPPFTGLSILDLLTIKIERKKHERRRKIEAWFKGKRSPFGMLRRSADISGPQCSSCSSNNVEDCARKAKTTQCDASNQCYTVHLVHKQSDLSSVIKGCIAKYRCQEDLCKKIINSNNGDYKSCKLDCCKGDMCNKIMLSKPLPKPPGPSGPKCYSCQGFDEASCKANRRETQCEADQKCASAFVVKKEDGKGILAKGCTKKSVCDSGLCKALNETGLYSSCKGVCCTGDLCDTLALNGTPTSKPFPKTTVTTMTTAPTGVKCFLCVGKDRASCDKVAKVVQCNVGERCYSGGATVKGSKTTNFARGCTSQTVQQCRTYCKTFQNKLVNCTYECCDENLCNKPGTSNTQPPTITSTNTQSPVTGTRRLWCTHCHSQLSEEDCESKRILKQCDSIDRVCYFGEAGYQSGEKMFAKGCMQPVKCKTACDRLGVGAKFCNLTCCKGDDCNRQIITVAPTKTPVKNPNIRALLKLIDAFKVLLEAIENSIRVSAMDFKASNFKDQISSLLRETQSRELNVGAKKNPVARNARRQLIELRTRADEVLKKLDSP